MIDTLALSNGMRLADALIGATAIEHGLTLLSANAKHFSAVKGLRLNAFLPWQALRSRSSPVNHPI